jgi:hypothetical protein
LTRKPTSQLKLVGYAVVSLSVLGGVYLAFRPSGPDTPQEAAVEPRAATARPGTMSAPAKTPPDSLAGHPAVPDAKDPRPPLKRLQDVTPNTPANAAYDMFLELKSWLARGPDEIEQGVQSLLEPNDGTPAQKRQRSLLYGALAETNHPAAAAGLVLLVQRAKHEDDKIQSAAALGDHRSPTEGALDVLWEASQANEGAAHNTALLAYGSVAHHLGTGAEQAPERLLAAARAASTVPGRVEVLAAMGNHGAPGYFAYLQEAAKDQVEQVRAAAVYGARFHEGDAAGAFIADVAVKDESNKVKAEALRALSTQLGTRRDYARVAQVALSSTKNEVQLDGARILRAALGRGDSPELRAALDTMRKETKNDAVRALLDAPL